MENLQESKTITIDDLGNKITFRICLFGAIEGLDFLERVLNIMRKAEKNEPLSIKPFLNDLLKWPVPLIIMVNLCFRTKYLMWKWQELSLEIHCQY